MTRTVVAIDLGASSGRVLIGKLDGGGPSSSPTISVEECSRFPNGPVQVPLYDATGEQKQDLHWDILSLWTGIRRGLEEAARRGPVDAIGIDTWAVDYGLLDQDGRLIGNPASYRSERTVPAVADAHALIPQEELYRYNGLQHQPFNTIFQLLADRELSHVGAGLVSSLLLLPDLIGYWLTGAQVCEVTNASTTGLLDPVSRQWEPDLMARMETEFGVRIQEVLPPLVEPGTVIGTVSLPDIDLRTSGGGKTPVIAVGSHDTASAVAGIPATDSKRFGFISSGTWSLVGTELSSPICSKQACSANFTNELGVDGSVRFLKNIMGMWVQQGCLKEWRDQGMDLSWDVLDAETEAASPFRTLMDINDPVFAPSGPMLERIDGWARSHAEPVPRSRGEYLRAITDSLAIAYRRALREAAGLASTSFDVIHVVGGGSMNALLCQETANATGLPVVAGPVEGTAMGNMVMQLRAISAVPADTNLAELRSIIKNSVTTTRYEPTLDHLAQWEEAERRLFGDAGLVHAGDLN
ncbi:rhamnulokinase [Ancrocorticia populi]|uniref:rhamnulokinase n=1 Tax=Ancrocorticia populi TaxID=2175228 RepID=UPI003F9AB05A